MPFQSLPHPRAALGAAASAWLPLAAASSLWLLLLMFGGPTLGATPPGSPLAILAPWQLGILLSGIGFLSATSLPTALGLPRHLPVLAVAALLWTAALLGYQQYFDLRDTPLVVGVGLVGLALGMAVGILSAPSSVRPESKSDSGGPLTYLALTCAFVTALLPFGADAPALSPFDSIALSSLPARIPQQVYALVKGAMLWVPLGFLFPLAGESGGLRRWTLAGVAAFFFVAWPFLDALRASDLLQVLYAPIGVWIGLWIGERTAHAYPVSQGAEAPVRVAATVDERPDSAPAPGPSATDATATAAKPDTNSNVRPAAAFTLPRTHLVALVPAIGLLALATWGWWDFPRFQLPMAMALVLYLVLLSVFRHAWLVAIPALLPVLDLAPWTGRFFFDESDLFLLATLGAALFHRPDPRAGPFLARPIAVLGAAFAATTLIALLIGLLPLSPLDANAFTSYFSHYNSLRVAKGFAWGLSFLLLLRWTVPKGSELPIRLFTIGLMLGLLGVILIGLRERWQFADLLDFSAAYRITASFSSMHTGGSHLPAFLALAVPFVWLLAARRQRNLAIALLGLALFAGAAYLVVATVTRASFLALAVELAMLALFWFRGLRGRQARVAFSVVAFAAMGAAGAGILYLGFQGGYFQHRLSMVERDADTRLNHWALAVDMMDDGFATALFGMGLGRFPETYLQRNPRGLVPGNFRYVSEAGNGFLMLGSGETLYMAQRVPVEPGKQYRLAFDLRGEAPDLRLTMPLCEKHLLDSRNCQWKTHVVSGDGEWQHKEATIDSKRVGAGNWLSRPPVEIFLFNGEERQVVAVDNLSLRAPDGKELLRNGDFSADGDFWFFKTHDHLAWHIKNLWVSLLFEQGWLGLFVFNLWILALLIHLGGPAWRGNPVAAAAYTAAVGFLTVGLFSSPFDAPRLTALFLAVLATGLHAVPAVSVAASQRRSALPWRRKRRSKNRGKSAATGKR